MNTVQVVSFSHSLCLHELNDVFPCLIVFAEDEQVSAV